MLSVVDAKTFTDPDIIPVSDYSQPEIQAMQRAVINIFARWGVSDGDAAVILDRMSYLIGIHKALRIIFADAATGYAWMSRPNRAFDGLTPIQLLKRGGMGDLARLRRYLDSARGGW